MDMFGNFYFDHLPILSQTTSTISTSHTNNGKCGNTISSYEEQMMLLASENPKRRGGRKKFRETRHPVYRGVRRKDPEKWVSEVRVPGKKRRIWLGTFPNAEMAARAHDVAVMALKGRSACLNFADSAWRLPAPASAAAKDIQKAATQAAKAFRLSQSSKGENSEEVVVINDNRVITQNVVDSIGGLPFPASAVVNDIHKTVAEAARVFQSLESSKGENSEEIVVINDDRVITQNVVDSTWRLPVPASTPAVINDIHKTTAEAARAFQSSESLEGENSDEIVVINDDRVITQNLVNSIGGLAFPASAAINDIHKMAAEAAEAFWPSQSLEGENSKEVVASAAVKDIHKADTEAAESFRPSQSSEGENSEELVIINNDQVITQHVVDSTWRLHIHASTAAKSIQKAAAEAFHPSKSSEGENSEEVIISDHVIQDVVVEEFRDHNVLFMDEEAIFDMPELLVNMAEGLMLPPPQCVDEYSMETRDTDMSLWNY